MRDLATIVPAYAESSTEMVREHEQRTVKAYSTRVVEGSPFNSLSTVPIMPWER